MAQTVGFRDDALDHFIPVLFPLKMHLGLVCQNNTNLEFISFGACQVRMNIETGEIQSALQLSNLETLNQDLMMVDTMSWLSSPECLCHEGKLRQLCNMLKVN